MHNWRTTRELNRVDKGLDLVQRCEDCGAGRRLVIDGDGGQEVIFCEPNPLPPCKRQNGARVEKTAAGWRPL